MGDRDGGNRFGERGGGGGGGGGDQMRAVYDGKRIRKALVRKVVDYTATTHLAQQVWLGSRERARADGPAARARLSPSCRGADTDARVPRIPTVVVGSSSAILCVCRRACWAGRAIGATSRTCSPRTRTTFPFFRRR